MNVTQLEGRWHKLAGQLKSERAKLEERYGHLESGAEKQIDKWLDKLAPATPSKPSPTATPSTPSSGGTPGDEPS